MLARVISDIWRSFSDSDPVRTARTALTAGDRERAVKYAEQALERDPECHDARLLLAGLYLQGRPYDDVLADIHAHLKPRTYVEIGIATGKSLKLVRPETLALGVDPDPALQFELSPNTRVFRETSDDFFARHDVRSELGSLPVDLAFIDGLHYFDQALRDFINLERLCDRASTILVHDCFPLDRASAQRERKSGFWSGDVWRLVVLLKEHRPDLRLHTIAAPPTGLVVIRGLDPSSRRLSETLETLVDEYMQLDYGYLANDRAAKLNVVANDWDGIRSLLDEPAA